jgi:hypothetical protein
MAHSRCQKNSKNKRLCHLADRKTAPSKSRMPGNNFRNPCKMGQGGTQLLDSQFSKWRATKISHLQKYVDKKSICPFCAFGHRAESDLLFLPFLKLFVSLVTLCYMVSHTSWLSYLEHMCKCHICHTYHCHVLLAIKCAISLVHLLWPHFNNVGLVKSAF